MNGTRSIRILVGAVAVLSVGVLVWIISLPSMAECRASGRVVDPTERHCTSGSGFQQLQEHATFHAVQVVVYCAVLLVGAYIIYRMVRRKSLAPTA